MERAGELYGGPRLSRWLVIELLGAGKDNVPGKRPSRRDSNRGQGILGGSEQLLVINQDRICQTLTTGMIPLEHQLDANPGGVFSHLISRGHPQPI